MCERASTLSRLGHVLRTCVCMLTCVRVVCYMRRLGSEKNPQWHRCQSRIRWWSRWRKKSGFVPRKVAPGAGVIFSPIIKVPSTTYGASDCLSSRLYNTWTSVEQHYQLQLQPPYPRRLFPFTLLFKWQCINKKNVFKKSKDHIKNYGNYQMFSPLLLFPSQWDARSGAQLFEAVITGISNTWVLHLLLGLSLFTGACLPPRVNLSVFFLCRPVAGTTGWHADWWRQKRRILKLSVTRPVLGEKQVLVNFSAACCHLT